uniref:NADH-ubiquinone oxidoreductase chain 2 n=1 Tax=Graptacme eborea TaxID=55752 RepID=Q68SQ6_GRAEB|nr:NADH dehydrogenase subunit 2 [Graptacme eborea]AAT98397.1 NADH dehydrogenase subunit 2 [Graptacme eborea]
MQKKKLMLILFSFIMILGTMMSLSSYYWLLAWIGLELNMIGFIPLMVSDDSTEKSESSMKYFIIQSLGSSMIIFCSIYFFMANGSWDMYSKHSSEINLTSFMTFALLLKMGAGPFHFWFPSVFSSLSWYSAFLLISWQKLAPFILLIFHLYHMKLMVLSIFCSALFGGIGGLNQVYIRPLLAYSSISHLSWMLAGSLINVYYAICYFIVYLFITLSLFIFLNTFNYYKMYMMNSMYMKMSILIILSLSGMPPTLGFLNKIMVLKLLANTDNYMMIFILIMFSMLSLSFYMSFMLSILMSHLKMSEFSSKNYKLMLMSLCVSMNIFGGLLIV